MARTPNLGDQFERLTVISTPFKRSLRWHVTCQCVCGQKRDVSCKDLFSGNTRSCGCLARELTAAMGKRNATHGGEGTPLYVCWHNMNMRCYNPHDRNYKHYGQRGIVVCAEWRHDFAMFRAWALAQGYRQGLTIERRNNDLGYLPDNCEWIPRAQQAHNKRNNHPVTAFGETKLMVDWSRDRRCVVGYITLNDRISNIGWDPERAITTPPRGSSSRRP